MSPLPELLMMVIFGGAIGAASYRGWLKWRFDEQRRAGERILATARKWNPSTLDASFSAAGFYNRLEIEIRMEDQDRETKILIALDFRKWKSISLLSNILFKELHLEPHGVGSFRAKDVSLILERLSAYAEEVKTKPRAWRGYVVHSESRSSDGLSA
jgi:hypothetical protein